MRTVLEILADGTYVSGEAMSRELGISRAAIWKQIGRLREEGWDITSGGKRGYRLNAGDSLAPALWQAELKNPRMKEGERRFLETVDSTNTEVKRMALTGAPHGSLCLAEQQTAGRGRLGRSWFSPAGCGLWVSVLLRPALKPAEAPLITFCTALAMQKAVLDESGLDVRIKWPNDLVCQGKKICGILLEVSADMDQVEYVVVGTGLNVRRGAYPPGLEGMASSLEELCGRKLLRRRILARYLDGLQDRLSALEQSGFEGIADDYRTACCTLNSRVSVRGSESFCGEALDIDESGALLIRDEDGRERRVFAGDVSVRGVMGYA